MTFIDELKQAIMATKGKFATDDFYHIAAARGAHKSIVSKAMRMLRDDFCIKIVGHRGSEGLKRDLICYEVVKGAKLVINGRKVPVGRIKKPNKYAKLHPNSHWWGKIKADPQYIASCRLNAAMSGWR